jgi:molybdopterin converting factor small subunit
MRLRVQYTAQLRTAAGRSEDEVDLPEGSNLAELLVHVASVLGREAVGYVLTSDGQLQPSLLVAVNNGAIATHEARDVLVNSGDVVMLLPPIAGG